VDSADLKFDPGYSIVASSWAPPGAIFHPRGGRLGEPGVGICEKMLDEGRIEELVAALRSIHSANPELSRKLRKKHDYVQNHTERMCYPEFRGPRRFVGSGVIEAGGETVMGSPL